MDYSLCCQTVTVYRMEKGQLQRRVLEGCHYEYEDHLVQDVPGGRLERRFLLIVPGTEQRVFLGDRIYDGIGPEGVDWCAFLPVNVPGLSQVAYVRPCWWGSEVCHIEAGRK